MPEPTFKIRDNRRKEMFRMDDEYLNGYARICGVVATCVYVSLCRHANKEQSSWPSLRLIQEELAIGSHHTVVKAIRKLEEWKIIEVIRTKNQGNNRQEVNTYVLLDKTAWKQKPMAPGAHGADGISDTEPMAFHDQKPMAPGALEGNTTYKGKNAHKKVSARSVKAAHADRIPEKKSDENDPMTLQEFVASCEKSPQRHVQIIGNWADTVGTDLRNKGQWRQFIRRHLRAARALTPFSDSQIGEAFVKVKKSEWLDKFTLETLLKFLV